MADKPTSPLAVPERGDPDRKRALNVLAQRRYRQRRRERIQVLERKARSAYASAPASSPDSQLSMTVSQQPSLTGDPAWLQSNLPISPISSADEIGLMQDNLSTPETGAYNFEVGINPSQLNNPSHPGNMIGFPSFGLGLFPESGDFGPELQNLETSQFSFPDDANLEVPELQVMKAGFNIAGMLDCTDSIWDLTFLRVLNPSTLPSNPTAILPPNLRPTEAQQRVPHHPLFDIFPWPSVRTKFIFVFSQPVQMRPPIARDPMALVQLFYDMDDSEGLRVSGSDWCSESNWEIGQAFFKNWWWVLDREVVDHSNTLRRKRGADKLLLPPQ